MIVWAMVICALVGFVLGTQGRLIALALTSALIAIGLLLAAPEFEGLTLIALIVTLQAFFLAGAVWRVFGPRFPVAGTPDEAPAAQAARFHAATAREAGHDPRID